VWDRGEKRDEETRIVGWVVIAVLRKRKRKRRRVTGRNDGDGACSWEGERGVSTCDARRGVKEGRNDHGTSKR